MKAWQIFIQFLLLGLTSFGGPAAHLAYFRERFVVRSKWLTEEHYGHLIALSQFLPGPGSSQVGFALGYHRAGLMGALAAFIGFTLPSFLIMYALAVFGQSEHAVLTGLVYGLKLLAVVVVLDAVIGMYKSFCSNVYYSLAAVFTAIVMVFLGGMAVQLLVLLIVGSLGAAFANKGAKKADVGLQINRPALLVFVLGIVLLPFLASHNEAMALINSFYQTGSLVFGGGHVVLPVLQASVGNAVTDDQFLMAYGAAQAIPGPMFALAAFLGAEVLVDNALLGSVLALIAIFMPGLLLMLALQNTWQNLSAFPRLIAASAAVNAAVVGLLLAALYKPVIVSSINSVGAGLTVLVAYVILLKYRPPILILVGTFAALGVLLEYLP